MELLVGALAVLAFVAIALRFAPRDAAGRAKLPRIVDDSIGMWAIRRMLGRPTDPDSDPFARFRRPSTALARRPAALDRPVGTPTAMARTTAPPRPVLPAAPPAVLGDVSDLADSGSIPPAWTTVERPAARGREFGASILAGVPAAPATHRWRTALRFAGLAVIVAIGGLAAGAAAAIVSAPNPGSASPPSASPTARIGLPGGSPAVASPR